MLKPLVYLHGNDAAERFGPMELVRFRECVMKQHHVRDHATGGAKLMPGWCRRTINSHVERIRRMFRWARTMKLVPRHVAADLAKIKALQEGRSDARETGDVQPVAAAVVDATLANGLTLQRIRVGVDSAKQPLTGS
jgi:hypothetical protein